jgi:MinD-like ATPase involved in chromosome partitioning or flagellar assembly
MIPQSLVAIGIPKEIVGEIEDRQDFHRTYLLDARQNVSEEVGKIVTNRSTDEVIFLLSEPFEAAAKVLHQRGYYVVVSTSKSIDGIPTGEVEDVSSAYELINQLGFSLGEEVEEEIASIDIFALDSLLENLGQPKTPEEERDFEKIEAIKEIANRSTPEKIQPLSPSSPSVEDDFDISSLGGVVEALDHIDPEENVASRDDLSETEDFEELPDIEALLEEEDFTNLLEQDEAVEEEPKEDSTINEEGADFASLFAEFTDIPSFLEQQIPIAQYDQKQTEMPYSSAPEDRSAEEKLEEKPTQQAMSSVDPRETTPPVNSTPSTPISQIEFNIDEVDDKLNELMTQYKAPATFIPERPQPKRSVNRKATIIAMFIAKGGTGKTSVSYTLAARLASVLSKNGNKRVAFLDANRGNADVAGYLGLDLSRVSTLSAIASEPFFTEDVLARIIYKDPQCNLDVIFSPSEADDQNAKLVRVDLYREVTAVLAEKYDYVFIDTPAAPGITGPEDEMDARLFTEFILNDANLLVGIITPSQPLINRTIKLFQVLTQPKYQGIGHGLDRSKIGVLLNRYKYTPGKGSLSEEDIRSQLASWTWWGRIPEIDEWQNYINIGNSQVMNPHVIQYIDPILFKLTREPYFSETEVAHNGKSPSKIGTLFSRRKK